MPNTNERDALTRAEIDAIVYECRQRGDDSTYSIVNAALAATAPNADVPTGAIVNGRTYIERIEQEGFECEAGNIQMCTDWQELRRCFETLADWAMHTAPNAGAPLASEALLDRYTQAVATLRNDTIPALRKELLAALAAAPAQQAGASAYSGSSDDHLKTISRFLSDVVTAAGLVEHGKQCKALAERMSNVAYTLRTALYANTRPAPHAAQQAGAPLPLVPIEDHNRLTSGPAVYTDTRVPAKSFNVARGVFGTASEEDDKRVYRTLQAAFHAAAPAGAPLPLAPSDAHLEALKLKPNDFYAVWWNTAGDPTSTQSAFRSAWFKCINELRLRGLLAQPQADAAEPVAKGGAS